MCPIRVGEIISKLGMGDTLPSWIAWLDCQEGIEEQSEGKREKWFENCSASYIFKMGKKSLENIFKKDIIPFWHVFS